MNNFRRPRQASGYGGHGALDGFVGPRPAGQPRRASGKPETSVGRRPRQIGGSFNRTDGFHTVPQPSISSGGAMAIPQQTHSFSRTDEVPRARKTGARRRKGKRGIWTWLNVRAWSRKRTILTVLSLLLAIGLAGGGYYFLKIRGMFAAQGTSAAGLQENVDPSLLKGEGDGRVNILMLGKGGPGHEAPDLTDTLLLASIDPIHDEAVLLSIPRDLYVENPSGGSSKINAVYVNARDTALAQNASASAAEQAGLEATEKVIEETMGVPVHYHVMVDFEAFRKAIDTVGGVTVDVKEQLYDPTVAWENGGNPLIAAVGQQQFNGQRALLYARSRMTSERGDFDRSVRQREIIVALKEKVLSLGTFGNPIKIAQLVEAFGDHARSNFSIEEAMRLYELGKDISGDKIMSVGLADPPKVLVTTDNFGGQSVVVPKAGTYEYKEIQAFVRNAFKDPYLRREDATILVLNGTDTGGLAANKAEELKSFGYNISKVGDSPKKGIVKTIVVDRTNGQKEYTKHYLEQRFGTTVTTQLPDAAIVPDKADFVIILGANETTSL